MVFNVQGLTQDTVIYQDWQRCWIGNGNQETPYKCQWKFGSCLSCIFELLRNGVSTNISVKYFCSVRHPSTSVRHPLGYVHLGCGNMP